eukprot:13371526-Heterocapsa_arctica.AAC.1
MLSKSGFGWALDDESDAGKSCVATPKTAFRISPARRCPAWEGVAPPPAPLSIEAVDRGGFACAILVHRLLSPVEI